MLRKQGVVGKFVEFFGPGLAQPLARRPRHDRQHGAGVRRHHRLLPGRRGDARLPSPHRSRSEAGRAGRGVLEGAGPLPHREHAGAGVQRQARARPGRRSSRASRAPSGHRTACRCAPTKAAWKSALADYLQGKAGDADKAVPIEMGGQRGELRHGSVVIAAITSCTNTSNPSVMLGAGLLARKAAARGLAVKPWVKTSLAPGSKVVTRYLQDAGLMGDLEKLGFNLVGYGCTTCIGNSGPVPEPVARAIEARRPRRRRGALGQPQLRGSRQSAHARQLPRLAAARRRLRAGRHHGLRPRERSPRDRSAGQAGVLPRHLADARGGRHGAPRRVRRALPRGVQPGVRRRRSAGRACRCPPAIATPGTGPPPTSSRRRSSRA